MSLLFTPEELLQYLYKETSPEKAAAIEAALRDDWTLGEKLGVIQESTRSLDVTLESPRMEVILRVMNYARETVADSV